MVDSPVVVADSAAYERGTEILTGYGNVILTDLDVRLTGDQGATSAAWKRCTLAGTSPACRRGAASPAAR